MSAEPSYQLLKLLPISFCIAPFVLSSFLCTHGGLWRLGEGGLGRVVCDVLNLAWGQIVLGGKFQSELVAAVSVSAFVYSSHPSPLYY